MIHGCVETSDFFRPRPKRTKAMVSWLLKSMQCESLESGPRDE